VESGLVVAQRRGGIVDDLGDVRVAGGIAGGNPGARAVGADTGDAALQVQGGRTRHLEAEIDVTGAVRRERRVDEDPVIVEARFVARDAVEGQVACVRVRVVRVRAVVDGAPGAGEIQSVLRREGGREARNPAVRRQSVVRVPAPEEGA